MESGSPAGPETAAEVVTVRLLNAPLGLWDEAEQYYAELVRELALVVVAAGRPDSAPVPERLLELGRNLTTRFAAARAAPHPERDAGHRDGREHVDVTCRVPLEAGADIAELGRLLREADELCRREMLMTLAAPPQIWAFNYWYVEQFVDQTAGAAPRPWSGPE